jgi:hypothetical protein
MHTIKLLSRASLPLLILILAVLASGASRTNASGSLAPMGQEPGPQAALTTGFTFHGQLAKNGAAYTGTCDFTFSLWDSASGGAQIGGSQGLSGVNVNDGVFSVVLNQAGQFSPSAFNGSARWLGIQVQCAGDAAPATLGRQALLPSPYALYAVKADHAATATQASSAAQANQANTATVANTVASSGGNSVVTAINDPATTGTINAARLNGVVQFMPAAEQLSVGDANGTAPMINLRGGSTCCSGPGGHTPAWFKVFQNGSFVATGNLGIGVSPMQGKGYRTSWDSYKGAFRSGYADNEWDDANVGFFSWAGGSNSTAVGLYSLAFGDTNQAESTSSIVFGSGNQVKGAAGFAAGAGSRVCDTYGVAFGNKAISGGPILANGKCDPDSFNLRGLAAVAIGYNVTADQDHSFAFGKYASNNGFSGTFVWSDGSATVSADTFRNTANNEFAARATGGFRFRTNLGGTTGCNLPAGSGVFNCTSDRNQKENFAPLDAEAVLAKLAEMSVQGWNYKDDPLKHRHVGATAQDFYAAFGLGGSDKEIGLLDINGINTVAIQALEKRTREVGALEARLTALEAEVAAGKQKLDDLEARLAALERADGAAAPASPTGMAAIWLFLAGAPVAGLVLGVRRLTILKRQ